MPEDFANRIGFREEPGTVFRPEQDNKKPNPWDQLSLLIITASVAVVAIPLTFWLPKRYR